MTQVTVIICDNEATAAAEAGLLQGNGAEVRTRKIAKKTTHNSDSGNTQVATFNKLNDDGVWVVTGISE